MIFEIEALRQALSEKKFYTINEAAEILRVHYITVYRLILTGQLDASKVAGVWRIPAPALIKYLESRHPFNMD